MKTYEMFVPTKTVFGSGVLSELCRAALPGKNALLVISNGKSAKLNGSLARTEEGLSAAGVKFTLFDRVEANPLSGTVTEGGRAARENGCDFIVALGVGSVMDAAKGMAVVATNGGDVWDYIRGGTGGAKPIAAKPLPIVAITTTAGTGSETDCGGVISNDATHEKIGLVDPSLFPVLALVDPELTLTVPPKYTAYQGFDALFHSTEGYISKKANAMGDMYALTAIENLAEFLPRAVADGSDLEARERVSFANTLSGSVMCVSSCTSEHSLEHAMSAYHQNLPHGAGLIMISLAYYEHLIVGEAEAERFVRMAKLLGKKDAASPRDFLTALCALQERCGVFGLKMSDFGIHSNEFSQTARCAFDTMGGLFSADPVPVEFEDAVKIYEKSYR